METQLVSLQYSDISKNLVIQTRIKVVAGDLTIEQDQQLEVNDPDTLAIVDQLIAHILDTKLSTQSATRYVAPVIAGPSEVSA